MICLDYNRPSKQMLPVLLETKHHSEKFSTSDTSLSRTQSAASIVYDMQLVTLLLLQDSAKSCVRLR